MSTPEKPTTKPRAKPGPKPRDGTPRVQLSTWTTAGAKAAIQNWTAESQVTKPDWKDGDTIAAMVEVCTGQRTRPVAAQPPAVTGSPS